MHADYESGGKSRSFFRVARAINTKDVLGNQFWPVKNRARTGTNAGFAGGCAHGSKQPTQGKHETGEALMNDFTDHQKCSLQNQTALRTSPNGFGTNCGQRLRMAARI